MEEVTPASGLGAAVASYVAEDNPCRIRILGMPGQFAPIGSAAFLLYHFGLNHVGIAQIAPEVISGGRA